MRKYNKYSLHALMHQSIQSFNVPPDILTFEDWLAQISPSPSPHGLPLGGGEVEASN